MTSRIAIAALTVASAMAYLPSGHLIVSYAVTDGEGACDKILSEAVKGVNVLVWFPADLAYSNVTMSGYVEPHFDVNCMVRVASSLQRMNLSTSHFLGVGGWNAPHPSPLLSGAEWFNVIKKFSDDIVKAHSRSEYPFLGLDGIDWDLEGHDDPKAPTNAMTYATLDIMGEASVAAKDALWSVSLVPAQSYFDCGFSPFDRHLTHAYPEYEPTFEYHGWNTYTYVVAKYGMDVFDFIDVQLYESYSRMGYAIYVHQMDPAVYLAQLAACYARGWKVTFENDPEAGLPNQIIRVPLSKLVIGLSNGVPVGKMPYIPPADAIRGFAAVGRQLRGAMFWNAVLDELPANGTSVVAEFATTFNSFFRVR